MKNLYELGFKYLLKFLGGVTSDQWERVKSLVVAAALDFAHLPGSERRAWVVKEVSKLWENFAPYLVNLLVDGAFGLLRQKGVV
jgi:hypothetical protein